MKKQLSAVLSIAVAVLLIGAFIWIMKPLVLTSEQIQDRESQVRSIMNRFMNYEPIRLDQTDLAAAEFINRDYTRIRLEQQCLLKGTNSVTREEMEEFLLNSEFLIVRRQPKPNS